MNPFEVFLLMLITFFKSQSQRWHVCSKALKGISLSNRERGVEWMDYTNASV